MPRQCVLDSLEDTEHRLDSDDGIVLTDKSLAYRLALKGESMRKQKTTEAKTTVRANDR